MRLPLARRRFEAPHVEPGLDRVRAADARRAVGNCGVAAIAPVGLAVRRVDRRIDAADVAPATEHREDAVGNARIVEALQLGLRPIGDPLVARALRGTIFFDERSEEHTSELQSLMRISYAVFCLKKKKKNKNTTSNNTQPV